MLGEQFLTERDKQIFGQAGYGKKMALGTHPALLVIDFTYEFVGPEREPIFDAVKKVRSACGMEAWDAVDCVARLMPTVRRAGTPVVYTEMDRSIVGPFSKKNGRSDEVSRPEWLRTVAELAPLPQDELFLKVAPSAFFGTNLIYSLVSKGVDTVIVVGGVTSGCVRCTVTDAFSYGFKVAVVRDGVFDRGQASGEMSLFDMNAKYADVISEQEALDYFESLGQNRA